MTANQLPTSVVIFGASGDLTHRKLIPALFNLHRKKRLPHDTRIVGFAIDKFSTDQYRTDLHTAVTEGVDDAGPRVPFDAAAWETFAPMVSYMPGNFTNPDDYTKLDAMLREQEGGPANRLYYLATAPSFFAPIATQLGAAHMADKGDAWRRLVVEKPFGHDLQSALELNRAIHTVFDEKDIYRIDHYLGKETAQNVLFFRFGNSMFE